MKAVVLEIHKDYCIVVTADGQFLRQNIPAGDLEIGDEITIEETLAYPAARSWVSKLAIAAAIVVVIGLGGFGLYRILPQFLPSMRSSEDTRTLAKNEESLQEVAAEEEEAVTGQEEPAMEMVVDESEESDKYAEEEAAEATGNGEQAAGIVEGIPEGAGKIDTGFNLDMAAGDSQIEVVAGNLLIIYQRLENEGTYRLSLTIENLNPDFKYDGIAALEVRTDSGDICGLGAFEFDKFSLGDEFQRFINLSCPGDMIRIELKGEFK